MRGVEDFEQRASERQRATVCQRAVRSVLGGDESRGNKVWWSMATQLHLPYSGLKLRGCELS